MKQETLWASYTNKTRELSRTVTVAVLMRPAVLLPVSLIAAFTVSRLTAEVLISDTGV